jgi:uncharacterized membrane protein YjgN (DUF898 family)
VEIIQKVSPTCEEIALLTSRNRRKGEHRFETWNQMGDAMTIYVAATGLAALVSWVVLGLLIQDI